MAKKWEKKKLRQKQIKKIYLSEIIKSKIAAWGGEKKKENRKTKIKKSSVYKQTYTYKWY